MNLESVREFLISLFNFSENAIVSTVVSSILLASVVLIYRKISEKNKI